MFCCNALQSMVTTTSHLYIYTYNIYKAADSRPSIRRRKHFDSKIRPLKLLHSQKKVVGGVDQIPFFENTKILCRDPYVLVNYSTMKIEIPFMLNLGRPITATATVSWTRLLYRWNLQGGGHLCHSHRYTKPRLVISLCHALSLRFPVLMIKERNIRARNITI